MVECCAAKSFPQTTISDIVASASISRTTFYKHFSDKRACFDGAVDACLEQVRTVARAAHEPTDPPAEAVAKATAAILDLMAAKPDLAQLLTGDAPGVEPAVVSRYRQLTIPAVAALWDRAGESEQPHLDPSLAFGRVQVLVFSEIAAGRAATLPELLPEVAYLAIAPFAGHAEAVKQARLAEAKQDPEQPSSR